MQSLSRQLVVFAVGALCCAAPARSDRLVRDRNEPERKEPARIALPYAFHTETLETAIGGVAVRGGRRQEQMSLFATGFTTTNSSHVLFAGITRMQMPFAERLFFFPRLGIARYSQQRFYADLSFGEGGERAGSNDSSEDNFIAGKGWDNWADFRFRYVFPIGADPNAAIHEYTIDDGVLVAGATGGERWNPLTSGRTYLDMKPFFQERILEQEGDDDSFKTSGIELALEYDNRDFPVNPSTGSLQRLAVTRDFGAFDSFNNWTFFDIDLRKYFALGETALFRQRVLAVDLWSAYVPTWEVVSEGGVNRINNRPPSNRGASLGGVFRMRGFPRGRFNDKAAIYYSAEYRLTPHWNPFPRLPFLRRFPIPWWQVVPFVEIGRVAETWQLDELHSDMKWSAGLSGRAMIGTGGIIRIDFAVSEEASQWWVLADHPF